jgi:hypothetical protein
MAGNVDPAKEEDIRSRAYQIWESEGRPEGEHLDHWYRAQRDLLPGDNQPKRRDAGPSPAAETEGATQATSVPQAPPALAARRKRASQPSPSQSGKVEQKNKSPDI